MRDNFRMYGWVPFHLSGIQKGIQFQHAVTEYSLKYYDNFDYQEWANNDKTSIILNGYTSNDDVNELSHSRGLQNVITFLSDYFIPYSVFREPDLNNTLTAVVAILPKVYYIKEERCINELELLLNHDNGGVFSNIIMRGHNSRGRDLAYQVIALIHNIDLHDNILPEFTNETIIKEITEFYTIRGWLASFKLA